MKLDVQVSGRLVAKNVALYYSSLKDYAIPRSMTS